jgi:hypothetical protein
MCSAIMIRIMQQQWLAVALLLFSLTRFVQPASPLQQYSRLRVESQSATGTEYTGFCQPYQISSSFATSTSQCSFTICPNDVLSLDNCDVSCQATNGSRFAFTGGPVVQLQRSTGSTLVGEISSVSLSLSARCSARSSRVSCVSLDNYHVSTTALSSCQPVTLQQSCGATACTSLFRVRLFRPSSSSSSTSSSSSSVTTMAWSNRTAWSLVSSLSTTSVATGHCALLSYPFTLTTATTTSTTSSSFHQSSTMILMIVLICVGVFTSCSLYRVYGVRCRSSWAAMRSSVQPQGGGPLDAHTVDTKHTAWWFFKTNIIKPLLPVTLAPTAPPSPAPPGDEPQPAAASSPAGPAGRAPMTVAVTAAARPSSSHSPPVTPPRHQTRSAESTVPVATLVNPFTVPTTPPAPRVGEHVRPYRSVILHPELGSPAIAMPATPSPWSPIY